MSTFSRQNLNRDYIRFRSDIVRKFTFWTRFLFNLRSWKCESGPWFLLLGSWNWWIRNLIWECEFGTWFFSWRSDLISHTLKIGGRTLLLISNSKLNPASVSRLWLGIWKWVRILFFSILKVLWNEDRHEFESLLCASSERAAMESAECTQELWAYLLLVLDKLSSVIDWTQWSRVGHLLNVPLSCFLIDDTHTVADNHARTARWAWSNVVSSSSSSSSSCSSSSRVF